MNRKELVGKYILYKGFKYKIVEIISAHNYGRNGIDCWYIEFRNQFNKVMYWKQDYDGGQLVS